MTATYPQTPRLKQMHSTDIVGKFQTNIFPNYFLSLFFEFRILISTVMSLQIYLKHNYLILYANSKIRIQCNKNNLKLTK